jgi:hypothetical protein
MITFKLAKKFQFSGSDRIVSVMSTFAQLLIFHCSVWQPTENHFVPSLTASGTFSTANDTQKVYVNVSHAIDEAVNLWYNYESTQAPGLANACVFIPGKLDTIKFKPDFSLMSQPGYYSAQFTPVTNQEYEIHVSADSLAPVIRSFIIPGDFELLHPIQGDTIWAGSTLKLNWTRSAHALYYTFEILSQSGFTVSGDYTDKNEVILENFGLLPNGRPNQFLYNSCFTIEIAAYWKSNPVKEYGEIFGQHRISKQYFFRVR